MRLVYAFDEDVPGGRELLGGKGIGLAEMTALGIPVPAGFTITTDACRATMEAGEVPEELWPQVDEHVARLEGKAGKRFGDATDPLLVSVRSGAAVSMPGMMDTILNLGIERRRGRGARRRDGEPALRVRLLPPPDPDVRRGRRRRSTRTSSRASCRRSRRSAASGSTSS